MDENTALQGDMATGRVKPAATKPAKLRDDRAFLVTDVRSGIWYPTDDGQLARLVRGDCIPHDELKLAFVASGQVARGLPAVSVAWMLERGWIEAAPEPVLATVPTPKEGGDA